MPSRQRNIISIRNKNMKLTLKKNTVMQLSKDLDVVPMSLTNEIAGGGTNGCTGTAECEHTGQCHTSQYRCNNTSALKGCTDPSLQSHGCVSGGTGTPVYGSTRVCG